MTHLMAAMTVVGCGVAGLTLDLSNAYVARKELQLTVDSAALGSLDGLPVRATVQSQARQIVELALPPATFGEVVKLGDVEVGTWSAATFTPATPSPNAVRVTAHRQSANGNPVRTIFANLLGFTSLDISARAVAMVSATAECIHALRPLGKDGLALTGGSRIDAPTCGIMVNSSDAKALLVSGGGSIVARHTNIVGGASTSGGSTITPVPALGVAPRPDPLAGLTPPAVGACAYTNLTISGGARALLPGVYCGGLIAGGGAKLSFAPGIYVIKDGMLKTTGGGSLDGDGVGFFLTGPGARTEFSGGTDIRLLAPRSGPMQGLIFWQGPGATAGDKNKITGGGTLWFEGSMYFPDQRVEWSGGTAGTTPPYTIMIAQDFLISGGGSLRMDADYGLSSVPLPPPLAGGARRRLVN